MNWATALAPIRLLRYVHDAIAHVAAKRLDYPLAMAIATFVLALSCAGTTDAAIMRFITSVGNIDIRLYNALAPNSVANFLNYANSSRYNGTFIHRVPQNGSAGTANFVVQGGGFLLNNSIFAATGIMTDAPIGDEPNVSNQRGTIAFAKNQSGATSQWFFNIGDNSGLDPQGFTVFGRVVGNGMTIVDAINNMTTVNASSAQNAPGEDFDEIPVKDLQKVLNQGDITNSDAVVITSVIMRPIPPGDYDFNGRVEAADYTVWKNSLGSTTNVAADGNGNGIVDAADYTVWRNTLGQVGGAGAIDGLAVPEPAAMMLVVSAATFWIVMIFRSRGR